MRRSQYQFLLCLLAFTSCTSYLEELPDRSYAILDNAFQYQQLLNQTDLYINCPALSEFGIDDYFLTYDAWASRLYICKNAYIWKPDIYEGNNQSSQDWNAAYQAIYHANVVLDGLERLNVPFADLPVYRQARGHALFVRAYFHYLLQETYGQPYRPSNAASDLGIPLKLSANPNEPLTRASVEDTFRQIVEDLNESLSYLVDVIPTPNKIRPSKTAVHALLSRVFLTMQRYEPCAIHADSALASHGPLIDFNKLPSSYQFPYPDNSEIIFVALQIPYGIYIGSASTMIDTSFYASYDEGDLRKVIFFKDIPGSDYKAISSQYSGGLSPFSGLASDELYLNRAEANCRLNLIQRAVDDLTVLLRHRYRLDNQPIISSDPGDLLSQILKERRKELVFRGTRWSDLRRLNQEPEHAVTLVRRLDGKTYTLPPNSPLYTYPIPPLELAINKFPQNERQ